MEDPNKKICPIIYGEEKNQETKMDSSAKRIIPILRKGDDGWEQLNAKNLQIDLLNHGQPLSGDDERTAEKACTNRIKPISREGDEGFDELHALRLRQEQEIKPLAALSCDNLTGDAGGFSVTPTEQPIPVAPSLPDQAQPIIVPADDIVVKQKAKEPVKNRMSAVEIAEILRANVAFRMVDNALYAYIRPVYVFLDTGAALRLIMRYCRDAARDYGDGQIIRRVYDLIVMEPEIAQKRITISDRYITFRNTVLDVHTGASYPPSPNYFNTAFLDVDYVSGAIACPNFDAFLATLAAGDPLLVARVWEMLGYLLSNDISAKVFFVMQGVLNSGKSKLGEFIKSLFNIDAVTNLDIATLGRQFGMADIIGKRLNASLDLPAGTLKSESVSIIKQLTGGDMMTADIKFMPRVKFQNSCKLLFATNHPITLSERDDAFFDRLVAIPFTVSISREQCDHNLLERFEPEKSAIVNKALGHYRQLKARNYIFSGDFQINSIFASGAQAPETQTVFDADEQVCDFVHQRCMLVDEMDGKTLTVDLFNAYREFRGDSLSVLSLSQFSETLKREFAGYVYPDRWRETSSNPQRGFRGIVLKVCADVSVCQGG